MTVLSEGLYLRGSPGRNLSKGSILEVYGRKGGLIGARTGGWRGLCGFEQKGSLKATARLSLPETRMAGIPWFIGVLHCFWSLFSLFYTVLLRYSRPNSEIPPLYSPRVGENLSGMRETGVLHF